MKTIEQHKKDGTYQKCRHEGRGIPIDPLQAISNPEGLTKLAAEKWAEIVPPLLEAGLITIIDLPELQDAFVQYGIAQDCLNYVEENFETHAAYLVSLNLCKGQCDLLAKYAAYMDRYNKIMHKFGVTPIERAKIRLNPEKKEDDDDFIKEMMTKGA